jgi:hypothetical protein
VAVEWVEPLLRFKLEVVLAAVLAVQTTQAQALLEYLVKATLVARLLRLQQMEAAVVAVLEPQV